MNELYFKNFFAGKTDLTKVQNLSWFTCTLVYFTKIVDVNNP